MARDGDPGTCSTVVAGPPTPLTTRPVRRGRRPDGQPVRGCPGRSAGCRCPALRRRSLPRRRPHGPPAHRAGGRREPRIRRRRSLRSRARRHPDPRRPAGPPALRTHRGLLRDAGRRRHRRHHPVPRRPAAARRPGPGAHRAAGRRDRRPARRPRRRRALLRPLGPGRARRSAGPRPPPRRARRPRPPRGRAPRRPRRPRPPRPADPGGLRRQERADLAQPAGAGAPRRDRRRGRGRPRRGGEHVKRHLLEAADLDRDDATLVLDTAAQIDAALAGREVKKLPTLRGRTVVNLFFEDSTRTRISFELAAKRLSADVINFSAKGRSVSKGESLKDTALTLEAMGSDAIVVRHSASGAPHRLATWIRGSVVNAGDGTHEHPTQALLDAYTMRSRLGRVEGLRVAVVGDVLHSRVARSNVLLLDTLGAEVTLVAPPTLLPVGVEAWPAAVSYDLDGVLPKSDVVMMLRVQRERMNASYFPSAREYSRRYGLDKHRMAVLAEHAIVMHPGPMNRGVEIAAEVADSVRSTIVEQVANGISVRMAVLYLLLGGALDTGNDERAGAA